MEKENIDTTRDDIFTSLGCQSKVTPQHDLNCILKGFEEPEVAIKKNSGSRQPNRNARNNGGIVDIIDG